MMGFGWIGGILLIALVVYLIGLRPQIGQDLIPGAGNRRSPREILEERYARGEISKQEFDQMREDIS